MNRRLFLKQTATMMMCISPLMASSGQHIGKPTFLLLWSDTCPHCSSFIKNTLADPTVKSILKNNFIVEAVNVNKNSNVPYDIDFTGVVPSIHILNDKKSQITNTITGDIPAETLTAYLNKFLQLYKEYERSL